MQRVGSFQFALGGKRRRLAEASCDAPATPVARFRLESFSDRLGRLNPAALQDVQTPMEARSEERRTRFAGSMAHARPYYVLVRLMVEMGVR